MLGGERSGAFVVWSSLVVDRIAMIVLFFLSS